MESWLERKPYWEQYVWKLCFEKETLSDEDIEKCFQYLLEFLELIPETPNKETISFEGKTVTPGTDNSDQPKLTLHELKELTNVNALPQDLFIKINPNLTLIYGENGTGKSGIGRLLANACFSRGEREVLPNLQIANNSGKIPQAIIILKNEKDELQEIKYTLGDHHPELNRFSVFDNKSVLIHLDKSNNVNFTPAQVIIFDRMADAISKIEARLIGERSKHIIDNPFDVLFTDTTPASQVSEFCKGITEQTSIEEFTSFIKFDEKLVGPKILELQNKIDAKKKLDIPQKKKQLDNECEDLEACKVKLQDTLDIITEDNLEEINTLINDIKAKKIDLENIGLKNFDVDTFKTTGSSEWKTLISTAKILYENEKEAGNDNDNVCILCHQNLSGDAKSLFHKYWEFLGSKAESELKIFMKSHRELLIKLNEALQNFPQFLSTDTGIKILQTDSPVLLERLKNDFALRKEILSKVIEFASNLESFDDVKVNQVSLGDIQSLIDSKKLETIHLTDPTDEIKELNSQLINLLHQKDVASIDEKALAYLKSIKWISKASKVSFPSIKQVLTKKRTEFFNSEVLTQYKDIFNSELKALECDFNLVLSASGEQGNTVKELRLDFAEDYTPSHILSEGEQNVCSLADFLTEVQLDSNNCGIIIDDPVTSLDHVRKDFIAHRLVGESHCRQVVVLTHDLVFLSKLIYYADKQEVPFVTHWVRKVNGVPGHIDSDCTPKMASLSTIKKEYNDALNGFDSLNVKEQERVLYSALDDLRRACESLIEEVLFNKTIQRYDDHIRVQNLEEVIFDQELAFRIVELHGEISEIALMHNISDLKREKPISINDFKRLKKIFEDLERELRQARSAVLADRSLRKKQSISKLI